MSSDTNPAPHSGHDCINICFLAHGGLYPQEFEKSGHSLKVRVEGRLVDWCPPFPGYHACYPSRRQPSPAFSLLLDALRPHA